MKSSRKRLTTIALSFAACLALAGPAVASADWGAIAVNVKTGQTGISFGYGSANGAKARARHECGSRCVVAVWVRNGYAALVQKPAPSYRYFAGYGRTEGKAFRLARHRAHDSHAHKVRSVFSGY